MRLASGSSRPGNYANHVRNVLVDCYCTSRGGTVESCYSTRNQSAWADIANSEKRAFLYGACTEAGLDQAAPESGPSLISRVLQIDYTQEWRTWAFPKGKCNSIPETPDLNHINRYGGLNVVADRLAHINGDNDVWLDNCYHSKFAPSPRESTDLRPEYWISGGGHHWDSYGIRNIAAEPQFMHRRIVRD
ncbi:hypothetical protein B0O99DRAFT_673311 [Bisporella sp. PMI_857]|nr:hypothetical protein B0O99DRAFT_673311 [Bisporella sp. PMI_857]